MTRRIDGSSASDAARKAHDAAVAAQKTAPAAHVASASQTVRDTDAFDRRAVPKPPKSFAKNPGNVGVTATSTTKAGASKNVHGTKVGFSFSAGAFVSQQSTVAPASSTAPGGNQVISVNEKVGFNAAAGVKLGAYGISAGVAAGKVSQYSATVTPSQLAAIRKGAAPPSPYDPDRLVSGNSVVLKSGSFTTKNGGASFDGIGLNSSYTVQKDEVAKVTKLGGKKVQISTGPETAITNQDSIGLNVGIASASLGNSDTATTSKLHQVTLDLANPKARAAYAQFLLHGSIPTKDFSKDGITGAANAQQLNITANSVASLGIGPISISSSGPKSAYTGVEVKYATGNSSMQVNYDSGQGYTSSWMVNKNSTGKVTGSRVKLTVDKVADPQVWAAAMGNYSNPTKGNLTINITPADLATYQRIARQISASYVADHGSYPTAANPSGGAPGVAGLTDLKGITDLEGAFHQNDRNVQQSIAGALGLVTRWAAANHESLPTGVISLSA